MVGRALMILAASGLVVSCGSGPSGPQFGVADGEAIRQLAVDYAAAYNRRDVDGLQAMFAGNITFMPPNSSTVRGPESAAGFFSALFAELEPELELEVTELGGEGALAFAQGSFRTITQVPVPDADAGESEDEDEESEDEDAGEAEVETTESRDRGKWLLVLRKLAGEWRIEHLIWSSDLPPSAVPAPSVDAS